MTTRATRAAVAWLMAVAILLGSCAKDDPAQLTVLTRNLYLGADLTPLFEAAPADLGTTAKAIYDQVVASDVEARLDRVAGEIADAAPDVVALQEASIWKVQAPGAAEPSTLYDFVAILRDRLRAKGSPYSVAASVDGFSGGLPVPAVGVVTMQDRDVLLARDGSDVRVGDAGGGTFTAKMSVAVAGSPIEIVRGWASVEATIDDRRVRIVGTHLEAFDDPVRDQQQEELMAVVAESSLPTMLLGDLNSAAAGGGDDATYKATLAAGFDDTWSAAENPSAFTCCRAADLLSGEYTERIDFVLTKGDLEPKRTAVVGAGASSRTPSGRWSSDHAGVVSTVTIG